MGTNLMFDPSAWSQTGECCAQCDEPLSFGETIVMLQVVRPEFQGDHFVLMPLLDEDGDFLYEHFFLHFSCWEEIADDYKKEIEDTPPVHDAMSIVQCEYCNSGVREWETCGAATHGEFHRSKRAPSGGGHGQELVPNGAPDVICIHCLEQINENSLTFWSEGVGQDGECDECQHVRCWRGFDCECTCHEPCDEDETD